MNPEQRTVAIGAITGVLTMLVLVALLYHVLPPSTLATVTDRLVFTLRLHMFTVLPLFVMIASVGNRRFFTEAIDPLRNAEDYATQVNGRVVTNTLEQTLVFVVATLALATYLTPESMRLIPAAVVVFILARVAFWVGYRIAPLYRAPGMAATSYLNLGIILTTVYLFVTTTL